MNAQNSLLKGDLRSQFVLLCLLLVPLLETALAETFKLEGREYRLIDGNWYNFSSGQKGDEIVPERMIVLILGTPYIILDFGYRVS